jgi:hypothetical protein
MELLGQVRRGYFVDGLSGEQYATPEAVEALREAKMRVPGSRSGPREEDQDAGAADLVLINLMDPANPYGWLFPIADQGGNVHKVAKTPQKYLVLRSGRPVMLYEGRVIVLADLSREESEGALQLLTDLIDSRGRTDDRREIAIRSWNRHPIDVSPARHLLTRLGFVQVGNRWRGFVYDGSTVVDEATARAAEEEIPDIFEYVGKEQAPVVYDAAWVVARADPAIRDKLQELIGWLEDHLPETCESVYRPRFTGDLQILYRGMRCIDPHIQRRQVRVRIAHTGWTPGIVVGPDTPLDGRAFTEAFWGQFERTRAEIDGALDARRRKSQ